jgi:predicted nucleic acid-binding protein
VSGLLFEGNEATLLELGRVGAVKLQTNHYVLSEVSAVLRRREFQLTAEEIEDLAKYLHTCISVTEDPSDEDILSNLHLLRDRKDIPVAIGAMNSGSDYLVTGDKELLEAPSIPSITTTGLLQLIYCDQPDKNR